MGSVYRLGGDEFCALITGRSATRTRCSWRRARRSREQGGAFTVTSAAGRRRDPARNARSDAARCASPTSTCTARRPPAAAAPRELITAVLHAALAQRHPDLGEHSDDVAGDVELLARTIGLDEETIGLIIKAGDLHDVGKLGIPDEIITKPGPLNDEEWEFMRQHTVMGEQIIAAAGPSLDRIGPLVRASHERWDGKGYPDGLAGEEIPLGARIITICDSFRAMLDERVYKQAMSLERRARRAAPLRGHAVRPAARRGLLPARQRTDDARANQDRADSELARLRNLGERRTALGPRRACSSWAASASSRTVLPGPGDELHADRQALLAPVQRQAHRGQAGDVAEGGERHARDDVQHRLVGRRVLGLERSRRPAAAGSPRSA